MLRCKITFLVTTQKQQHKTETRHHSRFDLLLRCAPRDVTWLMPVVARDVPFRSTPSTRDDDDTRALVALAAAALAVVALVRESLGPYRLYQTLPPGVT